MGLDGAAYVTSLGFGTVYRILPEPSGLVMWVAGTLAVMALRYARRR